MKIYKIKKGKKYFYVRIEIELENGNYIGIQCYKETGEYIYTKWSDTKILHFNKSEIIK